MKSVTDLKEHFLKLNETNNFAQPRMIMIETRSRCNGLCSFCPANALVDTRDDNYMNIELYKKIINELSDWDFSNRISIYNNNEPFLDRRIFDFISYTRDKLPKAYIELKSNGTPVTIKKTLKAFNAGLDMLYINDYSDNGKHTKNVLKLKEDLYKIRRFGENSKSNNDFHRIIITLRDRGAIMGSRGGKSPNKKDQVNPYKNATCFRPSEMMTISPTGNVSICCEDFDWSMGIDDANQKTLREIWNSAKWREIREKLLKGERSWHTSCANCDLHGHSLELLNEYGIVRNQFDLKLIIRRINQKIVREKNRIKLKIKNFFNNK